MRKILILISLTLLSCGNDKLELHYFNSSQKEVLTTLLKENDRVLKSSYNLSIEQAYYIHLQELKYSENANGILSNCLFVNDKNVCEDFFKNELFVKNEVTKYSDGKKSKVEVFNLNLEGSYMNFLKSVSKNYKAILEYYKTIKASGSLSPSTTAMLLNKLNDEDLLDDNVRLIIGVHFLLLGNS